MKLQAAHSDPEAQAPLWVEQGRISPPVASLPLHPCRPRLCGDGGARVMQRDGAPEFKGAATVVSIPKRATN